MGGHGGLNILPQKRWNVYNYENREKVRRDEEAAAKEEQLKREQARKREAEIRLERLRTARGLAPTTAAAAAPSSGSEEPTAAAAPSSVSEPKTNHINLFEGIKIFDAFGLADGGGDDQKDGPKRKKVKKEEAAPKVVLPEDEKYKLGYGVAGKGVKLPWYLSRPVDDANCERKGDNGSSTVGREKGRNGGKKTLEDLREERLNREKREKARERALILEKSRSSRVIQNRSGYSRR